MTSSPSPVRTPRPPARLAVTALPLVCLLLATALHAQLPSALTRTVRGRVRSESGAALAGVAVTLRDVARGAELARTTDETGAFAFESVAPREYDVVALKSGFDVAAARVDARGPARELELVLRPGTLVEDVLVSATHVAGTPESVRRIPGSVEVLDPETLRQSHVMTTSEALRKVAGVNVRDEEGFGLRPNIGIRGLNPTRSSKVLLLEDGVPVSFAPYGDNATYYHPPMERFASVEVLKGSGQIAYGPSTVGGVVNYLTPDPPEKPAASLSLTAGNRGYVNGHLSAGGTFSGVGVLVDLLRKQGQGARDHVKSFLDDANVKVVVPLSERQSLLFRASYYQEDSNVTYSGLTQAEYDADPRQNPFENDTFEGRRLGGSLTHTLRLSENATLTSRLYASRFARDWWRQSSNSLQRPNDASDPACGGMGNLLTTCGNEGRLRRYVHAGLEPRLKLSHRLLGAAGELETGVRVHVEDQERRQENGDTPSARRGRLVEDNERRNQAYSAFAQERIHLGDLTITPGVRLEHVRYERTNRLAASGAGVSGRTSLTRVVPGLGLSYAPAPEVTVFAGAHRGFAPPRTEDVISNTTGGTVDLDPELSWNYELGARTELWPGVRADATGFLMDYENQIVPVSLAGGQGAALTNGGRTRHAGLEASVRLDSAPLLSSLHNLFLRTALTWVPTAEFRGVRLSSVAGSSTASVSGNRLPYAPETLLTIAAGYQHPAGVTGQLEAVHVSRQFGDDLNTVSPSPDGQRGLIPAHTTWNATVTVEIRPLRSEVFVTVKNLLDETYIVDRARGVLPGSPRLVQVGFRLGL